MICQNASSCVNFWQIPSRFVKYYYNYFIMDIRVYFV